MGCPKGGGMPDTAGGGGGLPLAAPQNEFVCTGGGGVAPSMEVGRSIPAGLYLCQSAPIIVGGLWRLPSPQGRNTPDRGGGTEQRCMEESLAPASCVLS